jgi:myo-inositol-1(or 4)-monophosphatase
VPAADLLPVLHRAATEVRRGLDGLGDWGLAGTRTGQYRSDLVADRAAVEVLVGAGLGVVSEESGAHHPGRAVVAVLDPVDGSTNASRGLPWYATSICAVDAAGPLAAVVVNQATGTRFEATRGGGARCDGRPVAPAAVEDVGSALIVLNGFPPSHLGWSQFRCLGAAALDLCAVASGAADAFVDFGATSLAPWDYLGGLLVCLEAGATVGEAFGRDLVVTGPERRTVVAACTPALYREVAAARAGV